MHIVLNMKKKIIKTKLGNYDYCKGYSKYNVECNNNNGKIKYEYLPVF